MLLEIGCPCVLLLGYARSSDGALRQVGLALQHPPTHLFAQAAPTLDVTGARADVAYAAAERYLLSADLPAAGQVEVEEATPALMGLGSDVLLGLCTARALAWATGQPGDPAALAHALALRSDQSLALAAYAQGGALVVATPARHGQFAPPLRRHTLAHADRAAAWGVVLYLPDLPNDTPLTLEAERAAGLHAAAHGLGVESGRLVDDDLWPALQRDDLAAFGRACLALHTLNAALLPPLPASAVSDEVLAIMAASGAAAWGRALTGHGLFALVRGAQAAADLRAALTDRLPLGAGRVVVTITDNAGARDAVHDHRPYLP